ncbi:MAG TPA: fumarylacetoacetate hydrolase family protein [Dehalococcoidia bacterium]|nr:fumarylacetoacetate hydrolase family protein [Dehalococcoidia bacterium]
MKIVRYAVDGTAEYGLLKDKTIQAIVGKPYGELNLTDRHYQRHQVRLMAPCEPTKIIAMGLNYHTHARELGMPLPNSPLTFLKPSTAVIGSGENIVYPSASHRVDYEGELAVIIKKPAWRVRVEDALDYVFGYACFNDVTARDLQNTDAQWTRAKGFDTFAAIGPWIETDLNPDNLSLETYLNGKLKQRGNTSDLIYSIPEIINFISNVMSLLPGDIIATGTPSGVGPMYPGDTVEVRIPAVGTLRNFVIANGD